MNLPDLRLAIDTLAMGPRGTIQLIVTDTSTGAIVIKTLTYNITNTA